MAKTARVLVVDDEQGARESLEEILEDDFEVVCADNGLKALDFLKNEEFDLVLMDLFMPKLNGMETLQRIKAEDKSIDVIMVSAIDRAREATAAIQSGAYDYITKPYEPEAILTIVERAVQKRLLEKEVRYLRSEVVQRAQSTQIISQSKLMDEVFFMIDKVARTTSSVLITGESGTGKELIARAIHKKSHRANKPFVAINCASIPAELIENELFGHEKGAYTGAHIRTIGKFELANRGTLFLDEISTLKLELQAKLLRVLQEREFTRVGGHRAIKMDVRVVAATNNRLEDMIREGKFREDLYFRLNVIPIHLPPLRARNGDIPILANYFIDKFNRMLNKIIKGVTPAAMAALESYPWPGNIRELENIIERMVVLGSEGQVIDQNNLPYDLLFFDDNLELSEESEETDEGLVRARQAFERHYIKRALQKCQWNQTEAARLLRIHRNTLIQKIKNLGIGSRPEPDTSHAMFRQESY